MMNKLSACLAAVLITASTLHADTLTWDGGDPSGNWQDGAGGWLNDATPDVWDNAAVHNASFTGTTPTTIGIHADGVTVSNMALTGSANYTLQTGPLTLSASTIDVASSRTLNITAPLLGTGGLTKTGAGFLTLNSTATTISGPINLLEGRLTVSKAQAIGSGDVLVEATSATVTELIFLTSSTFNNAITVDSAASRTARVIFWATTTTLEGNLTLKGDGLSQFQGIGSGVISGNITSESGNGEVRILPESTKLITISGQMDLGGRLLNKSGVGTLLVSSTGNTWGQTQVSGGTLMLGAHNALDTAAGLDISLTSGRGVVDLAGFNQSVANLSGVVATNRIRNTVADTTSTLTVGSDNTDTTFGGFIEDDAGTVALTKTGLGTLTLSGTNTYTGATLIQSGTLALSATGHLKGTEEIQLSAGATLNVTNVGGGLILSSVQTLSGSGAVVGDTTIEGTLSPGNSVGTLTMDNLTLADGATLVWEYINTGEYDKVETTDGTLTLAAGGTLYLTIRGLSAEPGFAIAEGDAFTLWNGDVANFDLATIEIDDSQSEWANGWQVSNAGDILVVTAIPEPSAISLIVVMAAMGYALRRKS